MALVKQGPMYSRLPARVARKKRSELDAIRVTPPVTTFHPRNRPREPRLTHIVFIEIVVAILIVMALSGFGVQ